MPPHSSPPLPRFLDLCLVFGALGCASAAPPAESPAAPAAVERSETPPAAADVTPAAASAPVPAPTPATAEPADTRSKAQIQAVIAANRARVRACYDAALEKNPGIQGDLVVSFVINPDGSVKGAEVNASESELHVPELDSCAVDVLKTLKFPVSSRGLESKVNFPFNFKP